MYVCSVCITYVFDHQLQILWHFRDRRMRTAEIHWMTSKVSIVAENLYKHSVEFSTSEHNWIQSNYREFSKCVR